ncbi:MAG TPA: mannose-6-phosphate isomerase, class I, partial [Kofleriaceae bacterium]|nr:mannose-6-phosphate isomerase, class I [Kofleriaceae bacterium]
MEVARLIAPVQHYGWGSREAIPRLMGRPPDGRPWAEVWMGAHPRAPARLVRGGAGEGDGAGGGAGDPLDRVIADRPEQVLGAEVHARFGARLPYLFKVLAADRPLSIQCHPDAEAARRGFAREEERGVARDAPERTYRDASHKPELIAALGRFEALVGFRAPEEIRRHLAGAAARALAGPLAALDGGGLEGMFRALMALSPPEAEAAVGEAAAALAGAPGPEAAWVRRLAAAFPRDPASLAPLYLNHVELAADQALYLGAGLLHAYLGG